MLFCDTCTHTLERSHPLTHWHSSQFLATDGERGSAHPVTDADADAIAAYDIRANVPRLRPHTRITAPESYAAAVHDHANDVADVSRAFFFLGGAQGMCFVSLISRTAAVLVVG